MTARDVMNKDQAAEYLQISSRTLNTLMKKHGLPYVKLDRRVLFRKSDIDKFLESKLIKAEK